MYARCGGARGLTRRSFDPEAQVALGAVALAGVNTLQIQAREGSNLTGRIQIRYKDMLSFRILCFLLTRCLCSINPTMRMRVLVFTNPLAMETYAFAFLKQYLLLGYA